MVNRPKGKLFALLAIFAAIGLVTASGAFTTVQADRTAEVNVAGDAEALLQLQPEPGANGDAYARTQNDQLEINLAGDFDGNGVSAQGVNPDALTEVNNVFNITNQGSQDVDIYITKTGANAGLAQFFSGTVGSGTNMTTQDNAQTVTQGNTIQVSIEIDTRGSGLTESDTILTDITVHAEATSS